jgi:kynurenine 3-monooxygenase
MSSEQARFTIVGAGLAGPLLACSLGRAGYRVDLYEKRPDPRTTELSGGRSINLALSVRGIEALRQVNLADPVLRDAIPMRGRMIHGRTGRLTFQPYGKDDSESINSVSRAGLNVTLLNAAESHASVRCHFRQKCTGIDLATATVELTDEATGRTSHVEGDRVVGADGAYSAVRAEMQKREGFDYSQDYLTHGYKELTVPPGPHGEFLLEKHALHIWPRHSFMLIALPNRDGSFTATLFFPLEGPESFASLRTDDDVQCFFEDQFPDAVPLMPTLEEDFRNNATGSLVTIRCRPWHVGGRVVLLGDACHAVVPFLGQGMNAAFEDCTVLSECLKRHALWEGAFRAFEARRKPHTDVLADLCVDNFLEMRDRVSSRRFLLRKKTEVLLHRLFPRWYLPLYTLVTFTRTPYADAVRRAHRQDRVVQTILGVLVVLGLFVVYVLLGGGRGR